MQLNRPHCTCGTFGTYGAHGTYKKARAASHFGQHTGNTQHAADHCGTDSLLNLRTEPSRSLGAELGASADKRSVDRCARVAAGRLINWAGKHHSGLTFGRSTVIWAQRRAARHIKNSGTKGSQVNSPTQRHQLLGWVALRSLPGHGSSRRRGEGLHSELCRLWHALWLGSARQALAARRLPTARATTAAHLIHAPNPHWFDRLTQNIWIFPCNER